MTVKCVPTVKNAILAHSAINAKTATTARNYFLVLVVLKKGKAMRNKNGRNELQYDR